MSTHLLVILTLALLATDHAGNEDQIEEHINAGEADHYESLIVQRVLSAQMVCLEIVLVLVQDRCAVCAQYTISQTDRTEPPLESLRLSTGASKMIS